ncbi:MAG: hypothetical protein QOF69_101 [Solirubrobacteraceae bacterium]|nr:hypothetical protein [Solirubrobacteraceae bacterium]
MQPDRTPQQLLTRRRVVAGAMTATIGATFAGFGSIAAAKTPNIARARTGGFKRARFAPHVGTAVKLRPAGAPALRAQLVAVEDLAGDSVRHLAGSQNAYALRFRAPSSLQLPQGTVGIRHPSFGVVRLFVTPSTSAPSYQDYIAVINRVLR